MPTSSSRNTLREPMRVSEKLATGKKRLIERMKRPRMPCATYSFRAPAPNDQAASSEWKRMLRKTLGSCARSSSGIGAHTSFRLAAASRELLVPKSIAYISGTNAEGMLFFRDRRPCAGSQEQIGQQLVRGDGRVAGKIRHASG